jgi:predicted nuclease of predicted toxin-antitoxin system
MARFFADEDFPRLVVDELRALGHDILTVHDMGMANKRWPDRSVFFFACDEQRIVLSKNRRDFFKLHRLFPNHPGLVLCTADLDFRATAVRINAVIKQTRDPRGQVMRVYLSA